MTILTVPLDAEANTRRNWLRPRLKGKPDALETPLRPALAAAVNLVE
jgi:hypothetical protein